MKCEACAALDCEVTKRVERSRMMEDLAAAFAVLGIFAWLDGIGYSQPEMTWALYRLGLYNGDHYHKLNSLQRDRMTQSAQLENRTLREMLTEKAAKAARSPVAQLADILRHDYVIQATFVERGYRLTAVPTSPPLPGTPPGSYGSTWTVEETDLGAAIGAIHFRTVPPAAKEGHKGQE